MTRIGSLFAGYGGLELGVSAALGGGEVVWHSEIDKDASVILARHWPDVPNLGDITAVDWSTVEPVDVLTGGFPCQDVSTAGRRAGMRPNTRSGLWTHMAYAINQLRPALVVAENVRGLLSAQAHSDLEPCPWCVGDNPDDVLRALGAVLGDLAVLGYDAQWCGIRAADVGAPHGRFRVFVVATDTSARGRGGGSDSDVRETGGHVAGHSGGTTADASTQRPGQPVTAVGGEAGEIGDDRPHLDTEPAADADRDSHRPHGARRASHGRTGPGSEGSPAPAADADGEPDGLEPARRPSERAGSAAAGADDRAAAPAADAASSGAGTDGTRGLPREPGGMGRAPGAGDAGSTAADADRVGAAQRPRDGHPQPAAPGGAAAAADTSSSAGRGPQQPHLSPHGTACIVEQLGDGSSAADAGRARGAATADTEPVPHAEHGDGGGLDDPAHGGGEAHGDQARPGSGGSGAERVSGNPAVPGRGRPDPVVWGPYESAIRRWEHLTGRPAPAPTEPGRDGRPRLSPTFVEWLMGLPAGWVTDVPISRNAQLKALGNGVVPQQAAAAVHRLLQAAAVQEETA